MKTPNSLKGFEQHGVFFTGSSGKERTSECPFCQADKKFYANVNNKLWKCQRCSKAGNFEKFLEEISRRNETFFQGNPRADLAENRNLPKAAFRGWGIGYDGNKYTIPVRDIKGKIQDLRCYRLGKKVISTARIKHVGLLGAEKIPITDGEIYVVEGEFDAIALNWLLRRTKHLGVVVSVPGASIFRDEWIAYFSRRKVILCYDHDGPGERGDALAREKLDGVAASIESIHWPEAMADGYDMRDFITDLACQRGKPKGAYRKLQQMMSEEPRLAQEKDKASKLKPISNKALIRTYRKWLELKDINVIRVAFGSAFANRLQGDPLWLFIVGPPSCGKSELIMSMSKSKTVHALTSLTPHSLISGAVWSKDEDPSLLPKLDGKILAIKDFTAIYKIHPTQRDEILGVFRDIYDGQCSKTFGTGVTRSYEVTFGIIGGITPIVEKFQVENTSLGERFIKVRMPELDAATQHKINMRSMGNINEKIKMRKELSKAGARCLARKLPKRIPMLTENMKARISRLANLTAYLRGVVDRDKYTQEVKFKPMREGGSRLSQQLAQLAIGIAVFDKHRKVGESEYNIIKHVPP